MKFKTAHFIAGAIIISAVALPMVTLASNGVHAGSDSNKGKIHINAFKNNMVIGTVTAVSGTTLTVTDAKGTVYTVDASAAKIDPGMKGTSGLSVANILVGDKVVVTGPVTGTSETAKTINDRSMAGRNIFMGKVTAVNGSMLTVDSMTGKTKTTYSVDASAATLLKGMGAGTAIAITDIAVGDRIFAIGTLSGTTVSATSVRDLSQKMKKNKTDMAKPATMWSGVVTSVSGSTITITGMNKTVYTVDASGATLARGMGKTSTSIAITDIKVGDKVFASGTLNGTTVTATSVRDLGQFAGGKRMHKPLSVTK